MALNSYLCVVHGCCLGACAVVCGWCVCLQGCAGTCITESFSLRSVPSSLSSVTKKEEVFHLYIQKYTNEYISVYKDMNEAICISAQVQL